jgi:hypothetical protein
MSRRDRATLVLGVVIAIVLVAYPLAYRLSRESPAAPAPVEPAVTPSAVASLAAATPVPSRLDPTPDPASIDPSWAAEAMSHLNAIGETFEYRCTPNGTPGPIWGTDVYTADSSVCTAGVHRGLITLEAGGTVRITMRPGLDIYIGSKRNGVGSMAWDHWDASYVIVEP